MAWAVSSSGWFRNATGEKTKKGLLCTKTFSILDAKQAFINGSSQSTKLLLSCCWF